MLGCHLVVPVGLLKLHLFQDGGRTRPLTTVTWTTVIGPCPGSAVEVGGMSSNPMVHRVKAA